jgi:PKD repeat protein
MNKHIKARNGGDKTTMLPLRGKFVPLVVATGLAVTAAPAQAAPTKLGPVRGLDMTISKPADRYVVASDWDDLAGATSYRVSLTSGGTVLQSDKVTESDWRATTTLGAGARVTLKVVPLAGKRPGKQSSLSKDLPDLTAPTGTFEVVQATPGSRDVTINQVALSDDVTPSDSIIRTINWGDGTPAESWSGASHTYAVDLQAYQPTVTLEDAAGNSREVPLGTVVVGDQTAPTGAFEATTTGWAGWTKVALTETEPCDDNFSTAENVTRTVAWGDGSTDTWTGGGAPAHVYAAAGTYSPTVTLADEAGNTTTATMANTVLVSADTAKPTVSLTKPTTRRTWVRKWVTLRGKAKDAATGVSVVKLRLVEKRGTAWYAYRGTTRRWVRGGTTQAAALRRTTLAKVRPTARNTWSYKVSSLRKGRFVVRVQAMDNVKNRSAFKVVGQRLTHS